MSTSGLTTTNNETAHFTTPRQPTHRSRRATLRSHTRATVLPLRCAAHSPRSPFGDAAALKDTLRNE
eukprot:scaffold35474_cov60-Phaeocystis_antarctica.AAC.5